MRARAVASRWLRKVGVEIGRYRDPFERRVSVMNDFSVGLLIDVGANSGQFALGVRSAGYRGAIDSYEPTASAFAGLSRNSVDDPSWSVHKYGVGDRDGEAQIGIASNSASSSLLPASDDLEDASGGITIDAYEVIQVRRLDTLYPVPRTSAVYLKADVQGYEMKVLEGLGHLLSNVVILELELSISPAYLGASTFLELLAACSSLGFDLYELHPGFIDVKTGRVREYDGMFIRRSVSAV